LVIIEEVADALKKKGINVIVKAKVEGISGVVHEVDLLILNGKQYAFVLLNDCDYKNFIKQFVKTIDLYKTKGYLLIKSNCAEKLFETIKPESTIVYSNKKDLLSKILSLIELE